MRLKGTIEDNGWIFDGKNSHNLDIRANFFALQAVLHDIENKLDEIVCLGDLVGYGSMPNECVTEIRNREITYLLGNHIILTRV